MLVHKVASIATMMDLDNSCLKKQGWKMRYSSVIRNPVAIGTSMDVVVENDVNNDIKCRRL